MSIIKRLQDKIVYNLDIFGDLDDLDIDLLIKDDADKILVCLIHTAFKQNNEVTTRKIIDYFDEKRLNYDPLPALTNIFLNPYFNKALWNWVIKCFPEKEGSGYFLDLINYNDDINSVKISKILLEIFPNITNHEWNELFELTNDFEDVEYHNIILREFLKLQTEKTGNYAKLPTYLIKSDLVKIHEYPNNIPNVKDAVNLILADFDKLNITLVNDDKEGDDENVELPPNKNQIENMLICQYAISTSREKITMLSNVKHIEDFDDINTFQEYGPVNSNYSYYNDADEDHICQKYGGCRMLLCNEYTNDVDFTAEDIEVTEWFNYKCDICNKKIKAEHHALRKPLNKGGWIGCYCSFQCLEKDVHDPMTAVSVGRMKEQIISIGIRDR